MRESRADAGEAEGEQDAGIRQAAELVRPLRIVEVDDVTVDPLLCDRCQQFTGTSRQYLIFILPDEGDDGIAGDQPQLSPDDGPLMARRSPRDRGKRDGTR